MHDLNTRLIPFARRNVIEAPPIRLKEISIVMPVKNQQLGVDSFLKSFFKTHKEEEFPLEIIVVDNNSTPRIKIQEEYLHKNIPVHLHLCRTKGAAAARNLGVDKAKGRWILFTDSDCIATETFVSGYTGLNSGCIAYSGHVLSLGNSCLDRYYDSQRVLIPPKAKYGELLGVPMHVVTANAIICRKAYLGVGGFNESYPAAGGECEDFSMRLWQSGNIGYGPKSIIKHDYQNGLWGFIKRFLNYGKGAYITEQTWKTKKTPRFFAPNRNTPANKALALFQFVLMLFGYWKEKVATHG